MFLSVKIKKYIACTHDDMMMIIKIFKISSANGINTYIEIEKPADTHRHMSHLGSTNDISRVEMTANASLFWY